jgi:hypothetical protein
LLEEFEGDIVCAGVAVVLTGAGEGAGEQLRG